MGVVGAGGAGFPTSVKAASRAEFMLANGAECEPLLHKDFELMRHYPSDVVAGLKRMAAATGAGVTCGSCRPELRRILVRHIAEEAQNAA